MKKFLSVFLVLVLTLSVAVSAAYADETSPGDTTAQEVDTIAPPIISSDSVTLDNTSTATAKIDKSNPLYLSLKEKQTALQGLRDQQKQVEEALKSETQANVEAMKALREKLTNLRKSAKDSGVQGDIAAKRTEIESLMEQRAAIQRELADAIQAKDKNSAASLRDQLKGLTQQIKEKGSSIKTLRESIKGDTTEVKGLKEKLAQLQSQVNALRTQELTIRAEVLKLDADKQQEWVKFYTAIRGKDLNSANSNMDTILSLKQQIISKLNSLLDIKKQINTIITSADF